jgi:hypothetical protein
LDPEAALALSRAVSLSSRQQLANAFLPPREAALGFAAMARQLQAGCEAVLLVGEQDALIAFLRQFDANADVAPPSSSVFGDGFE